MRVFISYRRDDAPGHAGRIADQLIARYGREAVFIDVEAIEAGEDFVEAIGRAMEDADAALVVIGPGWLGASRADGSRRLQDPKDFVRLEIEAALDRGIRTIPVLVQGASMPGSEELPSTLVRLSRLNAVDLVDRRFQADLEALFSSLEARPIGAEESGGIHLPPQPTPFVGRTCELAAVRRLIDDGVRLLTLTGPGGTGKTRLALQAAAETAPGFPDGVWWVPLAPLRDPTLVLPAVAQTLGMKERAGVPLEDTLTSALSDKNVLLLLDNCEHLLPDVAGSIGALRDAGGPTLVVTSRERLRIKGEQAWPVPTLNYEDGAALFVARARSVDPTFTPTPAVDELCARLDQLPLAVELAAARTSLFTPSQLLERLGQQLDLLTGERDADPRQRTLRATIEWSYDLLTSEEQDLFRRLSVFAGGFAYEAAERVCGTNPDALQSLLDKSILRRRDTELGPRYVMLESVREFAAERLESSGSEDAFGRHATWFATSAVGAYQAVRDNQPGARAALAADLPNVRGALAHFLSQRDARSAGDWIYGLWFYWLTEGLGREAATAADAWLALDRTELAEVERLPGLLASSEILSYTGDLRRAADLKHEALALSRLHADESFHGREIRRTIAATLADLARVELARGADTESRVLADEALALRREIGDGYGIGHALLQVGRVALIDGDVPGARACFSECVQLMGHSSDVWEAFTLRAECEILLADLEAAASDLRAIVDGLREVQDIWDVADVTRVAAMLALERGDPSTGAVLSGAFLELLELAGQPLSGDANWQRSYEAMTERLLALLGPDDLARERRRGAQLTPDEVLDLAATVASERLA